MSLISKEEEQLMTPTGWDELGKCLIENLIGGVTRQTSAKLLQALLNIHEQEVKILQDIQEKVDTLLSADSKAAKEHLDLADLPNRTEALVNHDILRARDLLIRAISQAPNDLEEALVRRNIAVCSLLLGEDNVALNQLALANKVVEKWLDALNKGETDYSKKADEYQYKALLLFSAKRLAVPAIFFGFLLNPLVAVAGAGTYFYSLYQMESQKFVWLDKLKKQIEFTKKVQTLLNDIVRKCQI